MEFIDILPTYFSFILHPCQLITITNTSFLICKSHGKMTV